MTTMIVHWQGQPVNTRRMVTTASRFKPGDFILFRGGMCKVATVQRDCPHLENLAKTFCMVTLETREGEVIPERAIYGQREIFRRTR